MGSIEPYDTASGKRYRVRYRKPDRAQSQKRGFKTKRDAQLFLASVEVSKSRGEYVDPTAGKIAVGAIADEWLANKRAGLKASSFHSIDVSARVFVLPRWAETPISSIRPKRGRDMGARARRGHRHDGAHPRRDRRAAPGIRNRRAARSRDAGRHSRHGGT